MENWNRYELGFRQEMEVLNSKITRQEQAVLFYRVLLPFEFGYSLKKSSI